ncbi:MAG: hypothetical protein Kow0031_18470 [Anaerolineae bacterium]
MLVLMMILTIIILSAFFGVLAVYLYIIGKALDAIGGSPDSYLAKLRLGLRAIEQETSHIPTMVTQLNQNLTATAEGLQVVDGHLVKTIDAVLKQERS